MIDMNIVNKSDKKEIILKLKNKLSNNNFNYYWEGFNSLPIAIYNKFEVYLTNFDELPKDYYIEDGIAIGKRTKDFNANTVIELNGQYVGIWDLDTLNEMIDIDDLYAGMVHEMFHGYQMEMNDKRFANESIKFMYNFNNESLALRIKEREYLLKAAFEEEENKKLEYINEFINIREHRETITGKNIKYEYGIESIEGTATYVEYKALQNETKLPCKYLIAKYGKELIENNEISKFRDSCYFSGVFIAFILDDICENWQADYTRSGLYLYDYLKKQVKWAPKEVKPEINAYVNCIIRNYNELREKDLKAFYINGGFHIVLEGQFDISCFDPMNITSLDGKLLHKHFVGLNNKYFIENKVITTYEDNPFNATSVEFFVQDIPKIIEDGISIQGIGELKGKVANNNRDYIIRLKQPFVNISVKGNTSI